MQNNKKQKPITIKNQVFQIGHQPQKRKLYLTIYLLQSGRKKYLHSRNNILQHLTQIGLTDNLPMLRTVRDS